MTEIHRNLDLSPPTILTFLYGLKILKLYEIRNPLSVARPGKVFILGGCCDENDTWKTVSIFQNDEWNIHGKLKQGRINFMAITYGTDVMIIGGTTQNKTS